MKDSALNYLDNHFKSFTNDLLDCLKIASISTLKTHRKDMDLCASYLKAHMRTIGLNNIQQFDSYGMPILYADYIVDPKKPTILFYGHYDVQPVDPLDLWDSPPFDPKIKDGYIIAQANKGLIGTKIKFPSISVGATENALLAACEAKGETILSNCAIEPEITDLIRFLKKLGYKIKVSERKIIINSHNQLKKKISHKVIFDRIEAGTYLIAGALIGKKLLINSIETQFIKNEIKILKRMGVKILKKKNSLEILKNKKLKKISIATKPYPGFPTDLQAQLMVLMTQAKGISKIKENIFENRFMHVPELKRMGAKIEIKNRTAFINGFSNLTGAEVMATDLRASVSLVLAGLVADNRTIVNRIYHLDRGYENLENKLKNCRAEIKRI